MAVLVEVQERGEMAKEPCQIQGSLTFETHWSKGGSRIRRSYLKTSNRGE